MVRPIPAPFHHFPLISLATLCSKYVTFLIKTLHNFPMTATIRADTANFTRLFQFIQILLYTIRAKPRCAGQFGTCCTWILHQYIQNFLGSFLGSFCRIFLYLHFTIIKAIFLTQQQIPKELVQIFHCIRNILVQILIICTNQRISEILRMFLKHLVVRVQPQEPTTSQNL